MFWNAEHKIWKTTCCIFFLASHFFFNESAYSFPIRLAKRIEIYEIAGPQFRNQKNFLLALQSSGRIDEIDTDIESLFFYLASSLENWVRFEDDPALIYDLATILTSTPKRVPSYAYLPHDEPTIEVAFLPSSDMPRIFIDFGKYLKRDEFQEVGFALDYATRQTVVKITAFKPGEFEAEVMAALMKSTEYELRIGLPEVYGVDLGDRDSQLFTYMKYYNWDLLSLTQDLDEIGKGLTQNQAIFIIRQVSLGLRALHRLGYVHGNLNPAAIQIEVRNEGKNLLLKSAVLGDFKLSYSPKKVIADENRTASHKKTLPYLAPEEFQKQSVKKYGYASDVFALSVMTAQSFGLHELVPWIKGCHEYNQAEDQYLKCMDPLLKGVLKTAKAKKHTLEKLILKGLAYSPKKRVGLDRWIEKFEDWTDLATRNVIKKKMHKSNEI